jgi:hypothetical protein
MGLLAFKEYFLPVGSFVFQWSSIKVALMISRPHISSLGPLTRNSAVLPPGGHLSGYVCFQISETVILAVPLFRIQNDRVGTQNMMPIWLTSIVRECTVFYRDLKCQKQLKFRLRSDKVWRIIRYEWRAVWSQVYNTSTVASLSIMSTVLDTRNNILNKDNILWNFAMRQRQEKAGYCHDWVANTFI